MHEKKALSISTLNGQAFRAMLGKVFCQTFPSAFYPHKLRMVMFSMLNSFKPIHATRQV
jgi:hypothetical protein